MAATDVPAVQVLLHLWGLKAEGKRSGPTSAFQPYGAAEVRLFPVARTDPVSCASDNHTKKR